MHLSSSNGENWLSLEKDHPAVGPDYPPAQIDALVNLLATIAKKYDLQLNSILTKQDIAPDRRKTDLYGKGMQKVKRRLSKFGMN